MLSQKWLRQTVISFALLLESWHWWISIKTSIFLLINNHTKTRTTYLQTFAWIKYMYTIVILYAVMLLTLSMIRLLTSILRVNEAFFTVADYFYKFFLFSSTLIQYNRQSYFKFYLPVQWFRVFLVLSLKFDWNRSRANDLSFLWKARIPRKICKCSM